METPNSTPGGNCNKCDVWIDGDGVHEFVELSTPIPAVAGLPEIRGFWVSVHKACFEGDEIAYTGKEGIA